MSKRAGKRFVIKEQKPQECEYCHKIRELRPYGRNGANICFECAMKDEAETKRQFSKALEGVDEVVVDISNLN